VTGASGWRMAHGFSGPLLSSWRRWRPGCSAWCCRSCMRRCGATCRQNAAGRIEILEPRGVGPAAPTPDQGGHLVAKPSTMTTSWGPLSTAKHASRNAAEAGGRTRSRRAERDPRRRIPSWWHGAHDGREDVADYAACTSRKESPAVAEGREPPRAPGPRSTSRPTCEAMHADPRRRRPFIARSRPPEADDDDVVVAAPRAALELGLERQGRRGKSSCFAAKRELHAPALGRSTCPRRSRCVDAHRSRRAGSGRRV